MKILHLGKYYPPFMGGIENFMAALVEQQCANGHEIISVVHHHEKTKQTTLAIENDVKVYRIPISGVVAYTPVAFTFGVQLNRIIKQEKPDLIHIHMPNVSAFWCLLFPAIRKIPWVIHWHADVLGAVPDLKIKLLYPLYRIFELAVLKKAKKTIATSPVYLASSEPLKQFKASVDVVPLGLASLLLPNVTGDVVNKKTEAISEINLLIIGRLTYYKGHKVMIAALAELKTQGIEFKLSIVGGGELFTEIKQQIEMLGLNDNIQLLGKLSNEKLAEELHNTDMLCLPSIERTEAFGVVLLEAMRASKPCLVTDVAGSGMSWVVQDNKTGFVVQHNHVDSLVDKLSYISRNRHLLAEYGAAGKKRFEAVFNIKAVAEEVAHLYNEVVD